MKKLKLKALELGSHEALSREQLKSVTGGLGPMWICGCPNGTWWQCLRGTEAACQAESSTQCPGEVATCQQEYSILG